MGFLGYLSMIRFTIAAVAAATLAAGPAFAQFPGQAAAPAAMEVNRATDPMLTCEQILAEANPLNTIVQAQNQANAAKLAEAQAAAAKTANNKRIGAGLMGGALAGATQFGMMRGALNNPLARQALQAASQSANNMAANAAAAPGATPTALPPSLEQQRMAVLLGLYQAKRCG